VSSSKYALCCAAALALLSVALPLGGGDASHSAESALACPATISVTEGAVPIEGWSLRSEKSQHRFERISVFNKDSDHEYDLAPDSQEIKGSKVTQTWNLQGYRTLPIFLSCHYRGTSVTVSREIPASLNTCTLSFETDKKGGIVGESSMACR
jgi:hypothetical protein